MFGFIQRLFKPKLVTNPAQPVTMTARPAPQNGAVAQKNKASVEVIKNINDLKELASVFDLIHLNSKNSNINDFSEHTVAFWQTAQTPVIVFDMTVANTQRGPCSALVIAVQRATGKQPAVRVADSFLIKLLINQIALRQQSQKEKGSKVADNFKAFVEIVRLAARLNASDIHVCARKQAKIGEGVQVLFRVDGRIQRSNIQMDYESCIAIMNAAWEQSQNDANQGSMFSENTIKRTGIPVVVELPDRNRKLKAEKINLRFQSLPTSDGFDVTLRLLWQSGGKILKGKSLRDDLMNLGFLDDQADLMDLVLSKTSGGIQWVGPTGSGKTTTMYTCINHLAKPELKIVTAEDPVECKIFGATQIQVAPKYDEVLKRPQTKDEALTEIVEAYMRADPDICMVSEIRGKDTGSAFEQLVLTGHLTLTSLHAESALGAFYRMSGHQIGVSLSTLTLPNFMLAVIYQRLLRKLCPDCSIPLSEATEKGLLNEKYQRTLHSILGGHTSLVRIKNVAGCSHCQSGEHDRTVCASILVPDYELLDLIGSGRNIEALRYVESLAGPLWEPNSVGKSSFEIAIYKMSIGEIDPREVEIEFEPYEFYLYKKNSNQVSMNRKVSISSAISNIVKKTQDKELLG